MSRTISLTFRGAIFGQETGEVPIALVTIEHADFPTPLRLCSAPIDRLSTTPLKYGLTSRGDEYLFCPMSIALPDDADERAPSAQLVIENVSRELVETIRSVSTPGTATLEMVLASSPDVVEIPYEDFEIRNAQYNADVITIEMSIAGLDEEPYPAGMFGPAGFPGLF